MAYYRKYHNRKVEVDGIRFDSVREASRWKLLRELEDAGEIVGLQRQVKYTLIPSQEVHGKVVEKPCKYIADFVYTDRKTGKTVVEDAKGYRTKDYIIKRKLMLWRFGIQIKEV